MTHSPATAVPTGVPAGEHPLVEVEHLAEFFPITGGVQRRSAR